MILALDPAQAFEYVPLSERDKPDAATFTLRPLTTVDRVELSSITAGEERPGTLSGALAIAAVRRCLIAWKGVTDAKDAPIPLVRDFSGVSRACLERLPTGLLFELANECFAREAVTPAEVGKS